MAIEITNRTLKKTIIGLVYLIIFSGIVFFSLGTLLSKYKVSQKTINVLPLQIIYQKPIQKNTKTYNFIVQIKNPNISYGAVKFKYTIFIYDRNDQIIKAIPETGFIMPNEIKYFLVLNWQSPKPIGKIEAKIGPMIWNNFNESYYNWLPVRSLRAVFSQPPEIGYLYVDGILKNNSPYFLKKSTVAVVIRNKKGNIIAVSQTALYDMKPQEGRYFKVVWNNPFLGVKKDQIDLDNIEVYPESNFIIAKEKTKLF